MSMFICRRCASPALLSPRLQLGPKGTAHRSAIIGSRRPEHRSWSSTPAVRTKLPAQNQPVQKPPDTDTVSTATSKTTNGAVENVQNTKKVEQTSNSHPMSDDGLATTRPAFLDLPTHPGSNADIQTTAKYYFSLGRKYLAFYKNGLKNVWHNYKLARAIKTRLGIRNHGQVLSAVRAGQISRNEYQILLRSQHDVKKLLPFLVVFTICGEFTPLVIPFLGTKAVPTTCVLPKQAWPLVATIDRNVYDNMKSKNGGEAILPPFEHPFWIVPKIYDLRQPEPDEMDPDHIMHLAHSLGLATVHIPWPIAGRYLARSYYHRRLKDRYRQLVIDDYLLIREGGAQSLQDEKEVRMALVARGTIPICAPEEPPNLTLKDAWSDVDAPEKQKVDLERLISSSKHNRAILNKILERQEEGLTPELAEWLAKK